MQSIILVVGQNKERRNEMIRALYFGICFATAFLGLIIAIHINFWLGMSITALFIVKFMLQLPSNQEL